MPFVLPIWVYWSFYNLLPSPLFCQRLMDIASKIGPFCGKMHQKRTFAKVLGQNRIADQFQAATISFLQLAMPYSLPAPTLSNFRRSQIRLHSNSEITHLKFNQATLPSRCHFMSGFWWEILSFAWSTFELTGEQATAKSKPLSTTLGAAAAFLLAATECICRMEISFQGGTAGGFPS